MPVLALEFKDLANAFVLFLFVGLPILRSLIEDKKRKQAEAEGRRTGGPDREHEGQEETGAARREAPREEVENPWEALLRGAQADVDASDPAPVERGPLGAPAAPPDLIRAERETARDAAGPAREEPLREPEPEPLAQRAPEHEAFVPVQREAFAPLQTFEAFDAGAPEREGAAFEGLGVLESSALPSASGRAFTELRGLHEREAPRRRPVIRAPRTDWRRAILLAEVLGPPVCEREPGSALGPRGLA